MTPDDVRAIAHRLRLPPAVEFNIEGDPRPDLLDLVAEVRPRQCTLVPVSPGEITSQAGWRPVAGGHAIDALPGVVRDLQALGIRVSLFVDAEDEPIRWAASTGADRVELYTEPFARAFTEGPASARDVRALRGGGLAGAFARTGVNAGHDLTDNRGVSTLPSLAVSIGYDHLALFAASPQWSVSIWTLQHRLAISERLR